MSKTLEKIGIFFIGLIVGAIIVLFVKPKPVEIDKNEAPTKTAPAEKPPDDVAIEEIVVVDHNKVEWLETELMQAEEDLEQAERLIAKLRKKKAEVSVVRDTVWDDSGIEYQVSKAEFLFDDDLIEIKEDEKDVTDYAIKLNIQANAFMPVRKFKVNELEVQLDRIFAEHYMPDIEQDAYSRGVTGVLVGGATLASFLSKNPYLAGGGILLCTEFCFDILGVF